MNTPWLTSAWRNSKSGLPWSDTRFWCEPVMKLSSASTRIPRSSNSWHRCEPMKPAPPETTARGLFAANAAIGEAEAAHRFRVVDVSSIDDDRAAHELLDASHVELAELIPLGDQHDRVRTRRNLVRTLEIFHLREEQPGSLHRGRVICSDFGASSKQDLGDADSRRLAHVVGFGFESKSEQTDHAPWELIQRLAQQVNHDHALVAIDLHHGLQQLRVIVEPFGDCRQCRDIFGKATAAPSNTGVEVGRADSLVEAHTLGDQLRVGSQPPADPGDLLDERDARGQE